MMFGCNGWNNTMQADLEIILYDGPHGSAAFSKRISIVVDMNEHCLPGRRQGMCIIFVSQANEYNMQDKYVYNTKCRDWMALLLLIIFFTLDIDRQSP